MPRAERIGRKRPRPRQRDVARDHEQCACGTQPSLRERDDIVPGDRLVGCGAGVPPVRVAPEDLLLEGTRRHVARLRQLHVERGEKTRPRQLELLRGERRLPCDIAEQGECEIGVIAQSIGRDGEKIVAGVCADAAAHAFDGRGDLLRIAGRRALGQELRDEFGDAFFTGRIVDAAGPKAQAERQRRLFMILDQQQRHAVGQRHLLERRKVHRVQSFRGRRPAGKRILRCCKRRQRDNHDKGGQEFHWPPPGVGAGAEPGRTTFSIPLLHSALPADKLHHASPVTRPRRGCAHATAVHRPRQRRSPRRPRPG